MTQYDSYNNQLLNNYLNKYSDEVDKLERIKTSHYLDLRTFKDVFELETQGVYIEAKIMNHLKVSNWIEWNSEDIEDNLYKSFSDSYDIDLQGLTLEEKTELLKNDLLETYGLKVLEVLK